MILRAGAFGRTQPATDGPRLLLVGADTTERDALVAAVRDAGWTPVAVAIQDAADVVFSPDGPEVVLVDWHPSDPSALDFVREIRRAAQVTPTYVVLLVDALDAGHSLDGMDAGADDCLTMPFAPAELHTRLRVALRTLGFQERIRMQIRELQATAAQVRQLQSLLPICSYCRRIRDDEHRWQHLDEYLSHHTHVRFTHGFCPQCYEQHVQPSLEAS